MEHVKGFHAVDYVVFALTLVFSLGIGLYHAFFGGKERTTTEYFMAGRNMQLIPVAISMFMSYISAILVLGVSAEMYTWGSQFWMASVASAAAFTCAGLTFVPLFYPLNLVSSYEYLENRFRSKLVRLSGGVLFILYQVLYMGVVMYAPATSLEAVTAFPDWASILATGVIATAYTALGGIRAVVWTDAFQGVIMAGGMLAVLIQGLARVGGFSKMWEISDQGGRIIFDNTNPDITVRMTVWGCVLGRFLSSYRTVGTDQTSVQRFCSLPTLQRAKWAVFLNFPLIFLMYSLCSLCGLTVYAYYAMIGCDPLKAGYISNANQVLPYFIMDVLNYPGLPGIFVAVLFSGALSSLSSSLNALCAVTWIDMLELKFHNLGQRTKMIITKLLVTVYGALALAVAFMAKAFGGNVLQACLAFNGGTGGPSLGLFMLGSFFPWTNWKGAVLGGIVGLSFNCWISLGNFLTNPHRNTLPTVTDGCIVVNSTTNTSSSMGYLIHGIPNATEAIEPNVLPIYKISFMWYGTIGCLITVFVGMIVSLITGTENPEDVDDSLIIPVLDKLCCCVPAKFRRTCRRRKPKEIHDAEMIEANTMISTEQNDKKA